VSVTLKNDCCLRFLKKKILLVLILLSKKRNLKEKFLKMSGRIIRRVFLTSVNFVKEVKIEI
jgi:hypothetical protein